MTAPELKASRHLADVKYEIRGALARRADELERDGYDIVKLNIGNPGAFGFRMPDTMRVAMVQNLHQADPYSHQKGIFPAREAVVMQQQDRGIMDASADDVFIGNGVSELIMMTMRALLNPDDEVLVPSPDYPLWTASVVIHGAKAVHYPCRPENGFVPDPAELAALVTPRTRAIVVINPNNPTGAVYPRAVLTQIAALAERHHLVVCADEIYDHMLYDDAEYIPLATLTDKTLCMTFGGLSKIYRACGLRVGWVSFTGEKSRAREYLRAVDLLASLRLCANVPGQFAVQTALGGRQSIEDLIRPGGRLYETRRAILESVAKSPYMSVVAPAGSMYAFIRVDTAAFPAGFDDEEFALALLEEKHVLVAPGTSFNVPYKDHFRVTLLPQPDQMREVMGQIDALLADMAAEQR
ncbi:MAG: aminotransferase class I/II-fold pyridoxal phosphate-dependent enzyme [Myxococcales bacterium]|nr:aminotransferase class I/II-fold pyridoxal phosphate-dependent enzyme [Myxococcales bacterium]MCB9630430.1 aminotransferase class I/II-fold pyridoxal phosphate-dependent enzyme [Sandaracinaceae bacterium]